MRGWRAAPRGRNWPGTRCCGLSILLLLGIVVNGFPFFHLDHMRIYGVLQRIGICYLVVGLFYLFDRRVWTKWRRWPPRWWAIGCWCAGFRCRAGACRGAIFPFMDMNESGGVA